MSSDHPPTQSRAAQVVAKPQRCTASSRSLDSPLLGWGTHVEATKPRSPPTGPEKIRSPSPAARAGPHAKQIGNGCPARPG